MAIMQPRVSFLRLRFPGAFAEGDAREEALLNCIDVAKVIVAFRKECDETLGFNMVAMTPESSLTVAMPFGLGANALIERVELSGVDPPVAEARFSLLLSGNGITRALGVR